MKEYNIQNTYQNFNRKNKWMGIIDYKSLLVLVIYMFIIFSAIRVLNLSLKLSMYLFLFFTVPIISAVIINVNNEVAIDVILIIIKFYIKKKIFINKKEIKKEKIKLYKKQVNWKIKIHLEKVTSSYK